MCLAILVLATVTVLISHSYFVNNSVLNETVSGRIEGKIQDYAVISMYVDGTEIDSMNDVPEGYIIDERNSYCYLSDHDVHDTNVTLHTNSSGEHTFSGISKGEKCIIYFRKNGPTSYWFAQGSTYTFPNYGGTLQTSGTATGHNVYIGQDDTKYYTCINVDGNEACLSQTYTQYGLEGHTLNSRFTSEQQNAAEAAIGEVFSDAGITGYSCGSYSLYAGCNVGDFDCGVDSHGRVNCSDNGADEDCYVYADGSAFCD